MGRTLVILLISWVCMGCAGKPALRGSSAGGPLRLLATDALQARALARSLVSQPAELVPLEPGSGSAGLEKGCHRFHVGSRGVYSDGPQMDATRLVDGWQASLRRTDGEPRWLLDPLVGVREVAVGIAQEASGLRSEGDELVVCVSRAVPDWPARLAHPALWEFGVDPNHSTATGVGPYRFDERDTFVAVRTADEGGPLIDRIVMVNKTEAEDEAALVAASGVDLAVLYGRAAGRLLDDRPMGVRSDRLAAWDKGYALWLNAQGRWVNDPRFRIWMAEGIDRQAMLDFLFDRQGDAVYRLAAGDIASAAWDRPAVRPFAATSSPRLTLSFVAEDPDAASIAARIKASLEQQGPTITLQPRPLAEQFRALEAGRFQMALIAHHPPVEDPVLALQHTLAPLGMLAAEALERLDKASRIADPGRRAAGAIAAEELLLRDARLVPLIRLHAWMVTSINLGGAVAGPYGILRFERAGWNR